MGAKTALLVFADRHPADLLRRAPALSPEATARLVVRTNPGWNGATAERRSLRHALYPPEGTVHAGSFPEVDVLCDQQVMVDRPSALPDHLLEAGAHRGRTILHAMHSVVDWFAYAVWEDGTLVRALSVSPGDGVIEDIGAPLDFEPPYWAGEHPVEPVPGWPGAGEPYPLRFHPLDLGEAALRALLGFVVEGLPLPTDIDAGSVELAGFRVPVTDPLTQEEIDEFRRTRALQRFTYGPDGTLVPVED
ncbi:hypothetical protein [Spirillospora sp. NPDC029432]|uniref:DUF6928 family protein n=1 Tax=Spirillospora sp. NPDC029432 TaxID=3154599 RepID=UPI0034536C82